MDQSNCDHLGAGGFVGLEGAGGAGVADVGEEVVPFVIDQDVGGEVFYLDSFDIVFGQDGGGASDGSQVEAAMLVSGIGDLLGAVAFGQHDHGSALFLEYRHIRVHSPGRGGAE